MIEGTQRTKPAQDQEDTMCSNCSGSYEGDQNVNTGEDVAINDDVMVCADCGAGYGPAADHVVLCHLCDEFVCGDCRKAHADTCHAGEDCLS